MVFCLFSLDKVLVFREGERLIQKWHHDTITTLQFSGLSEKALIAETKKKPQTNKQNKKDSPQRKQKTKNKKNERKKKHSLWAIAMP